MPATWESDHVHIAPWYQVTQASWRKYPNPHSEHVIAVDTLSRHVSPTGTLITERLLTCKQAVPSFLRRIFGSARDEADVAYALEISELDPIKRTYVARSVNLNFRHLVKVDEELTLDEDPADVMRTRMKQSVEVTAIGTLARLGRMAEDALVGKYKANAGSGKQALATVLDMILDEARELATPSTA